MDNKRDRGERERGEKVWERNGHSPSPMYKALTMLSETLIWNILPIKQAVSGDIQGPIPVICVKVPELFSPGMKHMP